MAQVCGNDFSFKLDSSIQEVVSRFFEKDFKVKESQVACLKSVLNGYDTLGVLPTGHGKTLIYQLLPHVMLELRKSSYVYPAKPILIIVSPLISLISEQVERCEKFGKAAQLLEPFSDNIKNGNVCYLFASPEMFLSQSCRNLFLTETYRNNVAAIVIDEAHTVVKWGTSSDPSKKAFRKAYAELGKLRCFFNQNQPYLCVTATANNKTKFGIKKILAINGFNTIEISPDKINAKLIVEKVGYDMDEVFRSLLLALKSEKYNFEKTIIYCRTIDKVTDVHRYFSVAFENEGAQLPFTVYHGKLTRKCREKALSDFVARDGKTRVLIGTSAIGMGIDIPDIRTVLFYGVPSDIESLVQGIGRGGRDGELCECVLFVRPCDHNLAKEDKHLKNYIENTTMCRRKIMMLAFSHKPLGPAVKHLCCDICQSKCYCEVCEAPPSRKFTENVSVILPKRNVTPSQRALVREMLNECNSLNGDQGVLSTASVTSIIPEHVITEITEKCEFIFEIEYIKCNFQLFDEETELLVLGVICDTFNDFEIPDDYFEKAKGICPTSSKTFDQLIDLNADVQTASNTDLFDCLDDNDDWLFDL